MQEPNTKLVYVVDKFIVMSNIFMILTLIPGFFIIKCLYDAVRAAGSGIVIIVAAIALFALFNYLIVTILLIKLNRYLMRKKTRISIWSAVVINIVFIAAIIKLGVLGVFVDAFKAIGVGI